MTGPYSQYGKRRPADGIKARSTRGEIGESWWSRRFITVLTSFGNASRLTRGRAYARAGQVLHLRIAPGQVDAAVQGSRPEPYQVRIGLKPYAEKVWRAIEEVLAEQALFSARLLAGEMPVEIEEIFAGAKVPLFPAGWRDLTMSCSCPDAAVPCKHIAATFYLLAEAFDDDPFEILHWRGRPRETLLANLRALRGDDEVSEPSAPATIFDDLPTPDLAEVTDRFWVAPVPLPPRPPALPVRSDLLLRQLPAPPASLGGNDLAQQLRELYALFAAKPGRP